MATIQTIKAHKKQSTNMDPFEDWVSTASKVPAPETQVLVIADGKVHIEHLCNESGVENGYGWYSWSAERCLDSVTHWTHLPELPTQFQNFHDEVQAEGLTNASRDLASAAERSLVRAKESQQHAAQASARVPDEPLAHSPSHTLSMIMDLTASRYGHWIDTDDAVPPVRQRRPSWEPESSIYMVRLGANELITAATYLVPSDGEPYWQETLTGEILDGLDFVDYWLKPKGEVEVDDLPAVIKAARRQYTMSDWPRTDSDAMTDILDDAVSRYGLWIDVEDRLPAVAQDPVQDRHISFPVLVSLKKTRPEDESGEFTGAMFCREGDRTYWVESQTAEEVEVASWLDRNKDIWDHPSLKHNRPPEPQPAASI